MNKMRNFLLSGLLLLLLPWSASAAVSSWSGAGPFTTGAGNQVINALALSPDGLTVYAGTGSGTVLSYQYPPSQTITFAPSSPVSIGASPVTLSASATSGLTAFTFATSSVNTICTVSGSTLTITGVGTCALTASQAGDTNWASASANANVVITQGAQATLTLTAPASMSFGATATLTSSGGNGTGVVTYSAGASSGCAVTGATLSVTDPAGTCSVTAAKAADSSYNAAMSAAASVTLSMGAQAISFGTAPTVTVGGTGTVTTTGGGSGIARVYASTTLAACTVNSSTGVVTGVAAGTNNCTITANQAGNTNYSAAAQASQRFSIGAAPVVPVVTVIPPLTSLPVLPGFGSNLPSVLNLNAGSGPGMVPSLVSLLSRTADMPLEFVEQTPQGAVVLRGFNGGNLAFMPLSMQTGDTRADGVYPVGNGQFQVVSNGVALLIAPALVHLDQLAALLPGVVASQADNGVITATLNGVTYVVQPGVGVALDAAGDSARLVLGEDGYFHFVDAQGNNQILYPAFSEQATLRSILLTLDPASTLSIGLNGTASIVFNGQAYTLVPDLTLVPIPADRVGQTWWPDGPLRFRTVNVQPQPAPGMSQGFTVR
jgi:hypothetical protein